MSDYAAVIAELDAVSRKRALSHAESVQLERAIREERVRKPGFEFGATPIRLLATQAAEIAGVPLAEVFGRSHARKIAYTRFAAMKIANERGKSLTLIGRVFSRDHTTVINAVRQAARLEASDPDFANLINTLREAGR